MKQERRAESRFDDRMQSAFDRATRLLMGVSCGASLCLASIVARAAAPLTASGQGEAVDADVSTVTAVSGPSAAVGRFRIDRAPGVSVSLGPYGGLTLLNTERGTDAHMVAGGIVHMRFNYVEIGGQLEVSDRVKERWRLLGGFVGGFIPFENWVDFEFALGAGLRRYSNPDQRYGAGGYDVTTPVLTLRTGLSDRLGQNLLGVRMGADLLFGLDLRRQEATWTYSYTDLNENSVVVRGTTPIGGVSVGIGVTVELDIAPDRRRKR